jgi:hypothetical protein
VIAFVFVLAIGSLIGFARGGSFHNIARAHLNLLWLVWAAALLQIAAQFVPSRYSVVAYGLVVVSYAVLFSFAGANWRVPGMLFIALGAALNYLVILVNQGMPISAAAAARAGFTGPAASLVLRGKHFVSVGGDASLMPLGDVIPLWRQPAVASVGDLIIWAGLILLMQELMRHRGRRRRGRRTGGSFIEEPAAYRLIDIRDADIDLSEPDARAPSDAQPDDKRPPHGHLAH